MHVPMVEPMGTLQVRGVPDDVSRVLKERAARAGQSLSEYVLTELKRLASQPTIDELWERIKAKGPVDPGVSATDIIRAERAERESRWDSL